MGKVNNCPEILDATLNFLGIHCGLASREIFNSRQQAIVNEEVDKLLDLGVVSPSRHEQGQCLSPIFVTPKRDGSYRLIFNFKNCNQPVIYLHFKMDTLNSVISIISPGAYFASLDLKHAYYAIPVALAW